MPISSISVSCQSFGLYGSSGSNDSNSTAFAISVYSYIDVTIFCVLVDWTIKFYKNNKI